MEPQLELAALLLRKANDDLNMARVLVADATTPRWGIGFHCQQAIEKSLKALLCSHDVEFPRTHNIVLLLDLLPESLSTQVPVERDIPVLLTPFGVLLRYDEIGPTQAESEMLPDVLVLLASAQAVLQWVHAEIDRAS